MGDAITFLQGHGTAELIQTEEGPRIIAFGGTRAYLCPGDSHFTPETDQSIYDRELMRTEAALLEMNKAVDILREEITAEANVDITNLNKADTTDSDKAYLSAIVIDNIPVRKILLLHYPPFNESNAPKEFGSTKLELVSADYLDFRLKEIM